MDSLSRWKPEALSVLRFVVALVFLQYGLHYFFQFPVSADAVPEPLAPLSLHWTIALIQFITAALILVGLWTRYAAFVAALLMAFAYWPPEGSLPVVDNHETIALFCFIFLYIAGAGAGPWSLDAIMRRDRMTTRTA